MKISFFSESQIRGEIPRDFSNARTEYAWMMALNAEHHPLGTNPSKRFDLGIVIVPKTNPRRPTLVFSGLFSRTTISLL